MCVANLDNEELKVLSFPHFFERESMAQDFLDARREHSGMTNLVQLCHSKNCHSLQGVRIMILITGGTGFIGRHLILRLLKEGKEIRCLVRPSSNKAKRLEVMGVQLVEGDVTDADAVKEAVKGCDTVYSLVGLLYEPKGYTFEAVHGEGVKNIVAACKALGVKRLIHISALGTSPEAGSRYHKTKLAGEEAIKASELDYTIFRPSVIFGQDDAFINLFVPLIRRLPVVGIISSGNYKMQPLYIEDLITCMADSLNNDKTLGQTYEIGGGEALTFNEIIRNITMAMNKKRRHLHIPLVIARPVAKILELFPHPLITTDQLIMLLSDNVCDNSKAVETFGLQLKKFSEGVKTIVAKK